MRTNQSDGRIRAFSQYVRAVRHGMSDYPQCGLSLDTRSGTNAIYNVGSDLQIVLARLQIKLAPTVLIFRVIWPASSHEFAYSL